jgi:putative ABC transport system permease protein
VNALFLAFAYLRFHRGRSLVLVLVAALLIFVPVATRILTEAAERGLAARAEATALVLGRRGSAIDLTMAALYFTDDRPEPLPMREVDRVRDSGLATPIPLMTAFETGGHRIVGTTLDYFDLRDLDIGSGRGLALLGEAVVGADAAEALGVGPGDTLVSAPRTLFDLDGVYPLELTVVGVLAHARSPDDAAVFVDLRTAWVIAGLGHGHADAVGGGSESGAAGRSGQTTSGPEVAAYRRLTPDILDNLHFHGDMGDYPVTAAIVVPHDDRAATLLRGRYLAPDDPARLVRPATVVQGLIDRLFRIRAVLDAVAALVALAALAAIALALYLGWRLRADEIATAVKLGAARGTVLRLVASETALILCCATVLAAAASSGVVYAADAWAGWLLGLGDDR